ncbi:DNA-directed RNA polymerase subunit beta [Enterococcus saccharolyticus]|uniref:DNA-directed RNA polymerase subunit beta n=1 Tax=Candidatus Enterococcus willemsii TaxID=1857215 RepID=A0ABQ6Z221_9ENTE|nr:MULTISPECIES: DNA-directed RNA polymerase subunit beta [Enterococcus]KAF1305478.1 DNA-directed RNA polymerase subunit beta [Enterococcus sp. CU12B]MCD5002769.1 DNA-directed RNA polymerase subunit beta [Enterococcus saccharolyticus]
MDSSRYILISISKVLVVILIAMILFFVGLMIGYGVIGDGSPFQVFDGELWDRILDFIR